MIPITPFDEETASNVFDGSQGTFFRSARQRRHQRLERSLRVKQDVCPTTLSIKVFGYSLAMTFMLLDGHQSATASRPAQVATHSVSPAPSVSQEHPNTSRNTATSARASSTSESEGVSLSMPVQPALSFQSSFLATFQTTTPLAKAPSAKAKDGALNHLQAAASIGVSPGLLNCYVAIYRSLGGQMPVQQGAAGFERRYAPELVAGFAKVRQQVREGADIRSAMAALQLQQDTKPSKKKRKEKLEHLLELNAHLSQQVSELRDELSAIKQQTVHPQADDPAEDSQDIAA